MSVKAEKYCFPIKTLLLFFPLGMGDKGILHLLFIPQGTGNSQKCQQQFLETIFLRITIYLHLYKMYPSCAKKIVSTYAFWRKSYNRIIIVKI